jgi:hypothetical protein
MTKFAKKHVTMIMSVMLQCQYSGPFIDPWSKWEKCPRFLVNTSLHFYPKIISYQSNSIDLKLFLRSPFCEPVIAVFIYCLKVLDFKKSIKNLEHYQSI